MSAEEEIETMTAIADHRRGPDPSGGVDHIMAGLSRRLKAEWDRRPPQCRRSSEPVMTVSCHWEAEPAGQRWVCDRGLASVVDGLSQEQAEAIVQQHNRQVTAVLGLLDLYLGAR